jgi:hypothetical protein
MNMLSMTSPSVSETLGLRTMVSPLSVSSSIFTSRSPSTVVDFSPW